MAQYLNGRAATENAAAEANAAVYAARKDAHARADGTLVIDGVESGKIVETPTGFELVGGPFEFTGASQYGVVYAAIRWANGEPLPGAAA